MVQQIRTLSRTRPHPLPQAASYNRICSHDLFATSGISISLVEKARAPPRQGATCRCHTQVESAKKRPRAVLPAISNGSQGLNVARAKTSMLGVEVEEHVLETVCYGGVCLKCAQFCVVVPFSRLTQTVGQWLSVTLLLPHSVAARDVCDATGAMSNCHFAWPWQLLFIRTEIAREPRLVQVGGCVEQNVEVPVSQSMKQIVDDPMHRHHRGADCRCASAREAGRNGAADCEFHSHRNKG